MRKFILLFLFFIIAETFSSFDYKLPSELSWCNEKVPLTDPEVRERAEREFYLLLQQKGQIVLYIKRSGKYFPIFEKIIKEQNLPDDLKYLSVAESALYMSRSSKSAFGLWQFMEGTAKTYGLRVDKFVDERANIIKSTNAAMKYLSSSKKSFGSWTLAAAAYNMGNTGVSNALKNQSIDNYWDLYLNEETSRFIFRIVLIKEIMKNPERYGIFVNEKDKYSLGKTKIEKVNGKIDDLIKWAKSKKNSYKDVRLLNPWILTNGLPDGNWEITIYDK